MLRRAFLQNVAAIIGIASFSRRVSAVPSRGILLQRSPLAGFRYYAGEALRPVLAAGVALTLVREPGNPHDKRAVRSKRASPPCVFRKTRGKELTWRCG